MTAHAWTDDSAGRPRVASTRAGAPAGDTVAGFEVLAQLGRGAGSTVYRVRRPGRDGTQYALKILDSPLTTDRETAAWRREAAVLASVDHPLLSRVHEVGSADTRPYLVMDLVAGRLLAHVIAERPLGTAETITLLRDLLGPLSAVHLKGLVHRDLKPANIIVLPDGTARLIDFGLVARDTATEADHSAGTFEYAAPEQSRVLRRPVDGRSDLYSLGVVAFECLTGHPPFSSLDVGELLRMHAVTRPENLVDLVPGIDPTFAAIIATLLAKDPDDRYQSGGQLDADLLRLSTDAGATFELRTAPPQPEDRSPLVGRTRELEQLRGAWAAARDGAGGFCLLRAPGGAGKTRLAQELTQQAGAHGAGVFSGKCFPGDSLPMASLRAALGDRLDALADVDGAAPTIHTPDQYALSVVGLLADLARGSKGLLLTIDDVQWLDDLSLLVLTRLADVLPQLPMLLLLTARTAEPRADALGALLGRTGGTNHVDIELGPLPDGGIAELVAALLPGLQAAPELGRLLVARCSGNPFVAGEYLRAIVDAGLLMPHWGTWLLDVVALNALELPETAQALVLSRVANLDRGTRDLLVTAAAFGARFRPDVLAEVHGIASAVTFGAVAQAVSRGLAEAGADGTYAFVHDRIREALLATLDDGAVAVLHQRIAETLDRLGTDASRSTDDVYTLARHYMAGPAGGAQGRPFAVCRAAGELALGAFAPAQAAIFLRHAAASGGGDGEFLVTYATALKQDGQYTDARHQLDAALLVGTDPVTRARIFALQADVFRSIWDTDAAEAALDAGLRELGAGIAHHSLPRASSTLVMYLSALITQTTGWRRGTAAGPERIRCTIIASLHEVGAYLGVLSMRPADLGVHILRALYWANRLGAGADQYARDQATYGFLCGCAGFMGTARRAFARAARSTTGDQPALRALLMHYEGAALFFSYHDNGESWLKGIKEQGHWLDFGAQMDALVTLLVGAVGAGRTDEAATIAELGRRRLGTRSAEITAMIIAEPIMSALAGEPRQAATDLRRVKSELTAYTPAGLAMVFVVGELVVLHEQNELGAPFDEAVARFEALKVSPRVLLRGHRIAPFYIAMGRLAQCRAAAPGDRAALARARTAVAVLGKAVKSDDLRARSLLAQADLKTIEGKPGKALSILGRLPVLHRPPQPLLAYEAARVRARAFAALGASEETQQQVLLALSLARHHGWAQQGAWVSEEFGLDAGAASGTASRGSGERTFLRTSAPNSGGSRLTAVGSSGVDRSRIDALERVGKAAAQVSGPGSLARIALDQTIRILHADRAFLFLTDDSGVLHPHLGRGADGADIQTLTGYSASLVDRVRQTRDPLVITGTDQGAALGAQSVVLHGLRSIMVAPLELEGRLLGVVYLDSQVAKGIFAASDVGILIALTNHIATSLETARAAELAVSVQTARRERDFAEALRHSLQDMADAVEPDAVLARLLGGARAIAHCDGAWLLESTPDGVLLGAVDGHDQLLRSELPAEPGLSALLRIDRPLVGRREDIPGALSAPLATAQSWIAVPLASGRVDLGVLVLAYQAEGAALDHRVEVASALAAQAATAYDRACLFAKVQALAVVDDLTGIANRRRFLEVAERDFDAAVRADSPLAAMMFDIDHFKRVNDTYGHPTGDDVIRTVAQRLSAQIRHTDMIGRYGGEEFAALSVHADRSDLLAERMRACIDAEPIQTRSGPVHVTVSVGVAHRSPQDTDAAAVLGRADSSLYRAKTNGRNQVHSADDPS